jgi:transposase
VKVHCTDKQSLRKGKKLGVGRKLSKSQEAVIFGLISTRRPFQLGFRIPYKNAKLFLWTRDRLRQLIQLKFDVKLTDGGIVNYLTRWGFPPLNRVLSKHDQCHVTIREWWVEHGEVTLAQSKNENALIYWMGEIELVGLEAIERSRNKRLTMIPVIENQGRVHWLTVRGEFDDERQLMLLNSLAGQSHTKIFLIRRTATHFKSKLVKEWLNDNKTKIEIFPPLEAAIQETHTE